MSIIRDETDMVDTEAVIQIAVSKRKFSEDDSEARKMKKKARKKIKMTKIRKKKNESTVPDNMEVMDGNISIPVLEKCPPPSDLKHDIQASSVPEQPEAGKISMITGSTGDLPDVDVGIKKKKKLRRGKKARIQFVGTLKLDQELKGNVNEIKGLDSCVQPQAEVNGLKSSGNRKKKKRIKKTSRSQVLDEKTAASGPPVNLLNAEEMNLSAGTKSENPCVVSDLKYDFQASSISEQLDAGDVNIIAGSTGNFPDVDSIKKKKKLRKQKKAKIRFMGKVKLDQELTENIPEIKLRSNLPELESCAKSQAEDNELKRSANRKEKKCRIKKNSTSQVLDEKTAASAASVHLSNAEMEINLSETHSENPCTVLDLEERSLLRKTRRGCKRKEKTATPADVLTVERAVINPGLVQKDSYKNVPRSKKRKVSMKNTKIDDEARIERKIPLHPDLRARKSGELESDSHILQPISVRRKLLVLDVNGLLADIVMPAPRDRRGDVHILGRAVFRRPFCQDFLNFCFQNFDIGIWSSRSKKIIDKIVGYLLGNLKEKLLFCWNMEQSTSTGFKTLENKHKPLVCKELRKIWENTDPNLRWKHGDYDESNTLLLDDSPYKALLNPLHTAIFPRSYSYLDKGDSSLGPGGDIRVYLEGLLQSPNVQKYVEENPFGQRTIDEQDVSWKFYSDILSNMSTLLQDATPRPLAEARSSAVPG